MQVSGFWQQVTFLYALNRTAMPLMWRMWQATEQRDRSGPPFVADKTQALACCLRTAGDC